MGREVGGSAQWQVVMDLGKEDTVREVNLWAKTFEGSDWVCRTGDFIGTFANDWHIDSVTIPAKEGTGFIKWELFVVTTSVVKFND